jgi:prevent-host-death family protein
MYNFKANEDILPLSEFRSNLAGYITQTRETGRPIIVTQNGRTAGVFVNASTWDEIQEKLEKMEAYEDLLVAEGEADRGEVVSIEDFEKEILARRAKEGRKAKSKTSKLRAAV